MTGGLRSAPHAYGSVQLSTLFHRDGRRIEIAVYDSRLVKHDLSTNPLITTQTDLIVAWI